MDLQARQPMLRWEKVCYALFFLFLAAYGCLVVQRTALLDRRMGDLDVFLHAAWAAQADADLYDVPSANGWHYIYPPLYAILLIPLADPPPGQEGPGYVPYVWSAAICYLINVACVFLASFTLANALEEKAEDASFRGQPRFCRRWWVLRFWPIFFCWLPIGHTMMRGQVNLVVLALLCLTMASWLRGQHFRAGAWLAIAICIKVIPAYLLVYPLWKRDMRGLLGCAAGLLMGLVVIPVAVFGWERTQTHYATYGRVFFGPFFHLNEDESRKEEILGNPNASESIGLKNAMFNWTYRNPEQRPNDLPLPLQAIYVLLGGAMTFMTLWIGSRTSTRYLLSDTFPLAGLILLMAILSPVCHSHYLVFCMPIVMCTLAAYWQFRPTVHMSWLQTMALFGFFVTMALAYLPDLEILKDRCAAFFATLPLWLIPMGTIALGASQAPILTRVQPTEPRVAA